MVKNCLTCKFEPDWSEPRGSISYPLRSGDCKYEFEWPPIPWIYLIQKRPLIRYEDDSGLPTSCNTWCKKED